MSSLLFITFMIFLLIAPLVLIFGVPLYRLTNMIFDKIFGKQKESDDKPPQCGCEIPVDAMKKRG